MDHEPERSDVVAGTYLRREAKEADELDGHEEGRGDAVQGHETKELLGVPTIHEHEVGPEQRRTLGVRHRSCVIKRTRDKVHAVVAVGQVGTDHLHPGESGATGRPSVGDAAAEHPLRTPRGAGGVEHRVAGQRAVQVFAPELPDELGVVTKAGDRSAHRDATLRRQRCCGRYRDIGEACVRDEKLGLAVLDDVLRILGAPPPAERGEPAP